MKVAVFGAGGVGAYFGGRLALAGAEVWLIGRGAHLEALRGEGLEVRSTLGDFRVSLPATDQPDEIGPVDFVLFTVKSQDTAEASKQLHPLLDGSTAVLSLQNGLGNEETIAAEVGWDRVMGGVAYIFSVIVEPGLVEHTAGPARVVFGEFDGTASERTTRLHSAFVEAGVDAQLVSDVRLALWEKFAMIVAVSSMTAAVRLPLGDIRGVAESWDMFRRLLAEVAAVAAAEGTEIPLASLEGYERFARELEPGTLSSLHHDLTHGRPLEIEALQGELVRRAHRHRVPVPMTEAVYAILRPWAVRNSR